MNYGGYNKYLILGVILFVFASCSTTKRLGESEVLYTGVKRITIESETGGSAPSGVNSPVRSALNVRPNNPLFSPYVRTPLPIGLWVWNYFYTERHTGFRSWVFRRFGRQPVLISHVQPEARVNMVLNILDNHGHFGSTGGFELHPRNNPKKARISYHFIVAAPWFYSNVTFPDSTDGVTDEIRSLQATSNIRPLAQYNIDSLRNERIRITNHLRNESYYYFRPEFLEYLADTTQVRYKVDLRMIMAAGVPEAALRSYDVGKMTFRLQNPVAGETDSTVHKGIKVIFDKPLKIRPRVLERLATLKPGDPASLREISKTITNLNRLGVFRLVNVEVTPLDSLKGRDSMDLLITAALDNPLQAQFETNFRSMSNSFIGPNAMFSMQNNNTFHGGERFNISVFGSYEWQTGNTNYQLDAPSINSYELGLNAAMAWPTIVPGFMPLGRRYGGQTVLNLGGSILNRSSFFSMFQANFSAGYDFQSSPISFHNWNVFRLVYTDLLRTTAAFDTIMMNNRALAVSFQNQFIPSMSYTYTMDIHYGKGNKHRTIWQTTATQAGNILAGAYALFGREDKSLFGNKFSQFVRLTTEVKNYYRVGERNTIAVRFLAGAGYAYGNYDVLPYSEQFYIGGAYSIRAFTIRSIGPGSFHSTSEGRYGYFDQTGEFKLEANLEYRFNLFGNLNGAVFLDAGNIWLLREDEARPGGKLTGKNFFSEIALGTGFGLRYDLNFLVIRADLGIALHAPYENPEKPGYYNIPRFRDGLGFHLVIGYPF